MVCNFYCILLQFLSYSDSSECDLQQILSAVDNVSNEYNFETQIMHSEQLL